MANFIWKSAKRANGMVVVTRPICDCSDEGSVTFATPTLRIMKKSVGSPITWHISSPKASPKPNTTHTTLTKPITMKLWSIVEITFFFLTIPP